MRVLVEALFFSLSLNISFTLDALFTACNSHTHGCGYFYSANALTVSMCRDVTKFSFARLIQEMRAREKH